MGNPPRRINKTEEKEEEKEEEEEKRSESNQREIVSLSPYLSRAIWWKFQREDSHVNREPLSNHRKWLNDDRHYPAARRRVSRDRGTTITTTRHHREKRREARVIGGSWRAVEEPWREEKEKGERGRREERSGGSRLTLYRLESFRIVDHFVRYLSYLFPLDTSLFHLYSDASNRGMDEKIPPEFDWSHRDFNCPVSNARLNYLSVFGLSPREIWYDVRSRGGVVVLCWSLVRLVRVNACRETTRRMLLSLSLSPRVKIVKGEYVRSV